MFWEAVEETQGVRGSVPTLYDLETVVRHESVPTQANAVPYFPRDSCNGGRHRKVALIDINVNDTIFMFTAGSQ